MKALFLVVLAIAIFGSGAYFTYKLIILPKEELKAAKALPPPPAPPDPTVPEFQKASAVRKTGKLLDAREALSNFVERYPESSKIDEARDMLGEVNTSLLLSTRPAPEKMIYVVKSGDVITRVARRLQITPELLMRANNLRTERLQIGQTLTYVMADFSLLISRRRERVTVLNKNRFFKQYPILGWSGELAKTAPTAGHKALPPPAKQTGKVKEKLAWLDGQRVIFTDPGFWDARFWIETTIKGCTLYPELDKDVPEKPNSKPPGGGIILAPAALTELGALMSGGDAVTLE